MQRLTELVALVDHPVVGDLDPCQPEVALRTLLSSVDEVNARAELFHDEQRDDNAGPFVLVVDDFYADPLAVRARALQMRFEQFVPPVVEIAGEQIVADTLHHVRTGTWLSTAVVATLGYKAAHPFYGERYNPEWLREELASRLHEDIDETTWETGGDYWNGAFHLLDEGFTNGRGLIHHHYKPGDIETRGWTGVVYLSENPPSRAGTTIWRSRETGKCIAPYGRSFDNPVEDFELVHYIENRFNRLCLFRENVLHRAERGWGSGRNSRLTQTFFFNTKRRAAQVSATG